MATNPVEPMAARDLGVATLRAVSVSQMDNNCYLLTCRHTGAQLLIDAADDAARLAELARAGDPAGRIDTIVTTHAHWDHVRALPQLAAATGARCVVGRADLPALPPLPTEPIPLDDGDTVTVGAMRLAVIGLVGHTPGSIALALTASDGTAHLFTGDSLFPGGVGNTGGDPERFASLLHDVTTKLFDRYPDSAQVHPGHGASTTLGAERPQLAEWRARGW